MMQTAKSKDNEMIESLLSHRFKLLETAAVHVFQLLGL